LVLKRFGNGVELRLSLRDLRVEFVATIFGVLFCLFGFRIEFLIFGTLLYFRLGFIGILPNALQLSRVSFGKFALRGAPRPLSVCFVVQRPYR
jgi:hypothetical protein